MTEESGQMDPMDPAAIHAALFNQDLLLGQHDQALHSFVEQKQVTYQCLDQMCSTIQSIHTGLPQASVTELAAWSKDFCNVADILRCSLPLTGKVNFMLQCSLVFSPSIPFLS